MAGARKFKKGFTIWRRGASVSPLVKVLIQRSKDGLFLEALNEWATSKEDAHDFGNSTPAIEFCVEHKLHEVRLYLSFEDPTYDFKMDVFRADRETMKKYDIELQEKQRELKARLENVRAGIGERKRISVQRIAVGGEET